MLTITDHLNRVRNNIVKAFGALESKGATVHNTEEEISSETLESAINTLECVKLIYELETGTLRIVTKEAEDETSQY